MRKIKIELVDYINSKMVLNGYAKDAVKNKNPRALFVEAFKACVGVHEEGSNNNGQIVKLIQSTIGNASSEAWCMATVQSMIAYVEYNLGVVSPLAASEHCLTVWKNTPEASRVKFSPLTGAIIIWQHGSTTNGHTGIFLESDKGRMTTVEGNAGNGTDLAGAPNKSGRDGIYVHDRSLGVNGDMKIVGFLKPF